MWQRLYEAHRSDGLELVSVAIDAQGPDAVRPYVRRAGATFVTLVDEENQLGRLLAFKAIPNGVLIDETGAIRYARFGGFDVRDAETRRLVEGWLRSGEVEAPGAAPASATAAPAPDRDALAFFDRGLALYRRGQRDEAAAEWRKAVQQDPENLVIRKQLWAVEHPERFYAGEVDFAWQREQLAKGQ